jgi:pimeloyl-ACP methyl ester carboxylesterase
MRESYHPFKSQKAKEMYLSYYNEQVKCWPVASEEKIVITSFGQTYIRISGPKKGMPLVLLSGDSENSLAWIHQIKALSKHFRTYAIDNIWDNGRSINTNPIKKPSDFVQWLDELFSALQLENINLIGFSYGGWLASLYALSYPERLNKLVLIAPLGVLPPRFAVLIRGILYYFFPIHSMVKNYLYWYNADSIKNKKVKLLLTI